MTTTYSNLPATPTPNIYTSNGTVQSFNSYYTAPIEFDAGTLNAMTGFFESRGFDITTSNAISAIIITQAQSDGYNPMTVLDSLVGLDGLEISELATQILNYNRFKSSFLGYSSSIKTYHEVQRNILA